MDAAEKAKSILLPLLTSLGIGGGSGAALSYYVQDSNAKAIEKLEFKQDRIERMIYSELKDMNSRLSRIEGQLSK